MFLKESSDSPHSLYVCAFLQEIQSLLTNWKGPDLIGYGELVLEGTFRLQRAKNERTLFLFDKLLLITKKREETYTYKAHILVSRAARSITCPQRDTDISKRFCSLTLFLLFFSTVL